MDPVEKSIQEAQAFAARNLFQQPAVARKPKEKPVRPMKGAVPKTMEEAIARITALERQLELAREQAWSEARLHRETARMLARTEIARRELEEMYVLPPESPEAKKEG